MSEETTNLEEMLDFDEINSCKLCGDYGDIVIVKEYYKVCGGCVESHDEEDLLYCLDDE